MAPIITPTKSSLLVLLLALFMYSTSAILPGVPLPGVPLPTVPLPGVPQQTKLTLYFRSYLAGPNINAVRVAGIPGNRWSPADFGTVLVIDQIITETPDPNAPIIARGQGIYVVASVDGSRAFTSYAVVFNTGPYAGSTLEVQGSIALAVTLNELAVTSGTGKFRLAEGYAVLNTIVFNATDALFRVDITVQT